MKRELKKIAKEMGFTLPTILCESPEMNSIVYTISVYKDGNFIENFVDGYFTDDEYVIDSKEKMLKEFREFLTQLPQG